ncbi:MAG: hypothetical protein LBE33_05590 [Zoogloeaceae bacterium]|nr:hypothetical protein [Zoogloeaceae bacterium]
MTVLFTRTGTPYPGRQSDALKFAKARRDAINQKFGLKAKVYVRFGGDVGQVVMIEEFPDLAAVEKVKRGAIASAAAVQFENAPSDVFQKIEETAWLSVDD